MLKGEPKQPKTDEEKNTQVPSCVKVSSVPRGEYGFPSRFFRNVIFPSSFLCWNIPQCKPRVPPQNKLLSTKKRFCCLSSEL